MTVTKTHISLLASVAMLSGCNALSASGPAHRAIDGAAAVKVESQDKRVGIDYALIDISKAILPYFKVEPVTSLKDGFGGGRGAAPNIPLGAGDTVEISIFEAQAGGVQDGHEGSLGSVQGIVRQGRAAVW